MKTKIISLGDRVRCIGSKVCGKQDCRHYHRHRASRGEIMEHDCRVFAWCPEVFGFVRDKLDYPWMDDDCDCDPNLAFRRKTGKYYEDEETPQ